MNKPLPHWFRWLGGFLLLLAGLYVIGLFLAYLDTEMAPKSEAVVDLSPITPSITPSPTSTPDIALSCPVDTFVVTRDWPYRSDSEGLQSFCVSEMRWGSPVSPAWAKDGGFIHNCAQGKEMRLADNALRCRSTDPEVKRLEELWSECRVVLNREFSFDAWVKLSTDCQEFIENKKIFEHVELKPLPS